MLKKFVAPQHYPIQSALAQRLSFNRYHVFVCKDVGNSCEIRLNNLKVAYILRKWGEVYIVTDQELFHLFEGDLEDMRNFLTELSAVGSVEKAIKFAVECRESRIF